MSVEDERYDPSHFTPPWVVSEHLERYKFATNYVNGKFIVDCACGSGEGTLLYAAAGAAHIHAFDIDIRAVESTAYKCRSLNNVEAVRADASNLPLNDNSLDLFISLETFEHLDNQADFLREVARILKPNSGFICSTPNRVIYSPRNQLHSKPWNRFHVREYSTSEFIDTLSRYFVDIRLFGQNPANKLIERSADVLAKHAGLMSAVRLKQMFKLPRLVLKRDTRHAVVPFLDGRQYEYLVAVCRMPA